MRDIKNYLEFFEKENRKDNEAYKRYRDKLTDDADIDWMDANVPGVLLNGEPLDGHYFDRMIDDIIDF